MTKLSRKYIDPEDMGYYINNLWSAFTLMDSKEDIRLLFKDLFTHTEYKMFAKRLEIARELLLGKNYKTIAGKLRVTPVTISRTSNILAERGDGLRKAHEKLNNLEGKYLEIQRERQKNLENHFRKKSKKTTLAGALVKFGVRALDEKISSTLKRKTAEQNLKI